MSDHARRTDEAGLSGQDQTVTIATDPTKKRLARLRLKLCLGILLILFATWSAKIAVGIIKWKSYIWLPTYFSSTNYEPTDRRRHVIFVLADHYEPGPGQKGVDTARRWLGKFALIADKHHDDYNNRFKYSWFYPYDHHNEGVLAELSNAAYRGYGEVEMHWHLPPSTSSEEFPGMLDGAVAWYQRYGALVSGGARRRTAFGYIAGNWGLDGARPGAGMVYNQLDTLFRRGCFADFSFSTIGVVSQPRKVNSLYYVSDDPWAPKSYDDGDDARVGLPVRNRLLMFEGPLLFNLWSGAIEYGAVEADPRPTPVRVAKWIDADIHVKGKPEWIFVKVYSHGAQSERVILDQDLNPMLGWLEAECQRRGLALHYMTAREAFNVVKAAELGKDGDPEEYRDLLIGRPLNTMMPIEEILNENQKATEVISIPWNGDIETAVSRVSTESQPGR